MKIGIIDADLLGRNRHRFPNLCCMKLSGWHKSKGDDVDLLMYYKLIRNYDLVYISKVFTDTIVPEWVLDMPNVKIGGTGFFYDKAEPLPYSVEHQFPDYSLYNRFVESQILNGLKSAELDYYSKWSIGFTTRGCFRKCVFCVNKNYDRVEFNNIGDEFIDESRPYVCLLDDNVLGSDKWESVIDSMNARNKRFQFKQGMDLRIVTDKRAKKIGASKYIGDYIFAFDNIADSAKIKERLAIWKRHVKKTTKLHVFCGFDRDDKWDYDFWVQDLIDTFERIKILMSFGCLPYIMRFNRYEESPFRGTYINLARWCNQPGFYKKMSYLEFCEANAKLSGYDGATWKYYSELKSAHTIIFNEYFNMKYENLNQY